MVNTEMSNLGAVFSYDSDTNILRTTLKQAHVLPQAEAERLLVLIKTYAASHPSQPHLLLEIGDARISLGQIKPANLKLGDRLEPEERYCLSLMSRTPYLMQPQQAYSIEMY